MSLAATYDLDMAAQRRYVSTLTPEARRDVTAATRKLVTAQERLAEAIREQHEALEYHRSLGVEPRDLKPLTATPTEPEGMHVASIARAIKQVRQRRAKHGADGAAPVGEE